MGQQNPLVEALREWATAAIKEKQEAWSTGVFQRGSAEMISLTNANQLGACGVLQAIINLDYSEIVETDIGDSNEHIRLDTKG